MTKETERFTLRLTGKLKNQLDKNRKNIGISLNALVVQILWEWVERQERKAGVNPDVFMEPEANVAEEQ